MVDSLKPSGLVTEKEFQSLADVFEALARRAGKPAITIGEGGADWVTADELAGDRGLLASLLLAQTAFTRDLDGKAQAAYLMIEQSMLIARAVSAPLLAADILPSIALADVLFRFDRSSREWQGRTVEETTTSLRLRSSSYLTDGTERAGEPDCGAILTRVELLERASLSIEAHFQGLVATLNAMTGLPVSALWRLIADSVGAVLLDAGRALDREDFAKDAALHILKQPGSRLTNRQFGYFELVLRSRDGSKRTVFRRTFRQRGGCCRFYTSRQGSLCSTCVLVSREERDSRLAGKIIGRLGLAERDVEVLSIE